MGVAEKCGRQEEGLAKKISKANDELKSVKFEFKTN